MSGGVDGLPPYARALGIEHDPAESEALAATGWDAPVLAMDFGPEVLGRPGFLHGGAMAGLLEMAAVAALQAHLAARGEGDIPRLKPVNVSVNFMRGGREKRTFAAGRVVRAGRRMANVEAQCWQDARDRLLATAFLNVMLRG